MSSNIQNNTLDNSSKNIADYGDNINIGFLETKLFLKRNLMLFISIWKFTQILLLLVIEYVL